MVDIKKKFHQKRRRRAANFIKGVALLHLIQLTEAAQESQPMMVHIGRFISDSRYFHCKSIEFEYVTSPFNYCHF